MKRRINQPCWYTSLLVILSLAVHQLLPLFALFNLLLAHAEAIHDSAPVITATHPVDPPLRLNTAFCRAPRLDALLAAEAQTNVTTRYAYDPLGNRTSIDDALGHAITYQYDTLNRLTTLTDALNHATSYGYDPLGRRTTLTDPKGQVTQYAYDILSRLATITYVADNKSVKFAYDAVGNRTVMTDTVGVTRYTYDDLYRLTQVVDPFTQTISYQYDAANNRTKLTYPDGKVVTYTYNAVNLLATVRDWAAKTTSYTYDSANRLITTTLPNTVLVVNRFDNANRLTQIQQTRTTTVLSRITYTVDPVGNRTKQDEYIKAVESSTGATRPDRDEEPNALPYSIYLPFIPYSGGGAVIEPAATPVTNTITYTYDPLYRVSKAAYSSPARTITYTYDAVGNRLLMGDAGKVTTYTYDIANRLTSAGGVAFSWDNNGNLLNDGKSTYTYDQANRLTKLVTGTQTYTMTYNGLSDRLTLSVNGTQTKYANDVAGGLTQVLLETTGATKNFYLYGNGLIAQQKSFVQYFGLDGLGSVRQLYNSSGQIVSDRQFDPYGNQMSKTGVGTSIYGFTGEQMDGSGLVYLRARYYAPGQGRFVTRDPLEGNLERPFSFNLYQYAYANPVLYADPSGQRVPLPCLWPYELKTDPQTGEVRCIPRPEFDGLPPIFGNILSQPSVGQGSLIKGLLLFGAYCAIKLAEQVKIGDIAIPKSKSDTIETFYRGTTYYDAIRVTQGGFNVDDSLSRRQRGREMIPGLYTSRNVAVARYFAYFNANEYSGQGGPAILVIALSSSDFREMKSKYRIIDNNPVAGLPASVWQPHVETIFPYETLSELFARATVTVIELP